MKYINEFSRKCEMEFNGRTNKLNSNIANFNLNRNPAVNNSLKVNYISIGSCILYLCE